MQRRDPERAEPAAIKALADFAGKRILEVGCGTGRLTRAVAHEAESIYAFDPKEESVKEARADLPTELRGRVSFRVHGIEALDVARRRFDIALCGWSL